MMLFWVVVLPSSEDIRVPSSDEPVEPPNREPVEPLKREEPTAAKPPAADVFVVDVVEVPLAMDEPVPAPQPLSMNAVKTVAAKILSFFIVFRSLEV